MKGIEMQGRGRRRLGALVPLCLATSVCAACGGHATKSESGSVSSISSASSASSGSSVSSGSEAGSSTEEKGITLPEDQELTIDYIDVTGIEVEPGASLAVVVKGLDSAYWKAVKEGASAAVDAINTYLGYTGSDKVQMTFEGTADDQDVDTQINTIDAVLAENPTALCLAAIDRNSCQAQLESARESEIPVVMLDSGVESDLAVCSCLTDNTAAGGLAAQKLCQAIGDTGEIALVAHMKNSQTSVDRLTGFRQELEENHSQVSVAEVIYENEDETLAQALSYLLEAYPDLDGIFCTNETMAEETLDVLAELKREDIRLVGFDAGKKQIKAIREGREYGTVCQNPYGMGYASVTAAFRAAAGQAVDSYIDSGYQWIDQTNMDLEENQKYLYQ